MTLRFWLPGEPVAQARARTVFRDKRKRLLRTPHSYYPKESQDYREWAALRLRAQFVALPDKPMLGPRGSIFGPVKLGLLFYRVRPKSNKSEWPTVKPDLDNYVKMLCDALMDAGILADDAQVCRLDAGKFWVVEEYRCGPGVEVIVEPLP